MTSSLGWTLVMASLLFASVGSVIGFTAGARRSLEGWKWARWCAYGFSASMILANFLMVYALLARDFSVAYVAEVGSHATPPYFTVISLWASLNGSILFWGGVLGVFVSLLTWMYRDKHREYMPYTLGVLLAVSVFFAFLVASIANPFAPVYPVPLDGPGPNPLLQNHWLMAWHPPALYLGYVGMTVPFAMCCAALLAGRLEAGWVAPLRRWMLVPWGFLTLGIVLGGWWAYEVLGWGGYWAWDPVENASLMPWLTGTAFLHSAMVLQRRGILKAWTLILGMSTFLLTLLGTFMTRSGVFNSVHSFTQSDIGPVFLGFIAVCLVFSVVLLALREHVIADRAGSGPAKSDLGHPLSREFTILAQNLAFAVFTFTVLLGVLFPLITEAVQGRQVSVGEPYFDRMALPIGLLIVFLMGVGPALPWGKLRGKAAFRKLAGPLGFGVAVVVLCAVFGIHKPYMLLAMGLCAFALWTNVAEFVEPVLARARVKSENLAVAASQVFRRSHRRFGGHIAHLGVIMAVVAIGASSAYQVERDFFLQEGETATLGAWSATFVGSGRVVEPQREATVARFEVSRNGREVGLKEPRLNFYPAMVEPIGTPAVVVRPGGDLYLSLLRVGEGSVSVRVMYSPLVVWLWISMGVLALGTFIAVVPARRRREVPVADAAPAKEQVA